MTFGDFPVESLVGLIQMIKIWQADANSLQLAFIAEDVRWCAALLASAMRLDLLSAHIILMMAPAFSLSALIAVNTGHWLWISFEYSYSVFDYIHLLFAKPRWPYGDAIDCHE